MSSSSKLEMSLDEIIKAQKGKGGQAQGSNKKSGFIGRKIATNNRGRKFGSPKGKRQVGGAFKRQTNANPKSINQRKGRQLSITPKRIVGRKPIGARFGSVRKNVAGNRAMIAATKNLVKKLVKNAIARNVVGTNRGKLVRIPANRLRQKTIMLNKISPKSRVISRRRVIPMQKTVLVRQQQQRVVRGRGPVQFAGTVVQQRAQRVITIPKRRNIQYVQQQPMVLQQRLRNFGGNTSQAGGVRAQIKAMRRANDLQQLQAQFINQQQQQSRPQFIRMRQQKQPIIFRQPRRQQQQVIIQQRPQRRPQQQQYVILQTQQPRRQQRQQFVAVKQQFVRRQPFRGQRQQQIVQLDPLYVPPNFLQRI